MMLIKLMPLLLISGIAVHSKDDIKKRVSKLTGSFERTTNNQRMGSILYAMQLEIIGQDDPQQFINNQQQLRQFIRQRVRIKGQPNADSSLDVWGTPFNYQQTPQKFTLLSAGPDRRFGTADDEAISQNIFDY